MNRAGGVCVRTAASPSPSPEPADSAERGRRIREYGSPVLSRQQGTQGREGGRGVKRAVTYAELDDLFTDIMNLDPISPLPVTRIAYKDLDGIESIRDIVPVEYDGTLVTAMTGNVWRKYRLAGISWAEKL